MKNYFLKTILASALGFILALGLLFVFFLVLGIVFGGPPKVHVKDKTVLELRMDRIIPERTDNAKYDGGLSLKLDDSHNLGLQDLVRTIRKAKSDPKVQGILLKGIFSPNGLSTNARLRRALEDFKTSGKFVVAHDKLLTQRAYYLASAADQVFLNPVGNLQLKGFASVTPFYKDAMDKLGIKAQVFYAGKFKSATEPFRFTKMSEANKLQVRRYIGELYDRFAKDIASSRHLTVSQIKALADTLSIKQAPDALAMGLVDSLYFPDQLERYLKQRLGMKPDSKKKIHLMPIEKYFATGISKGKGKDKIAVVYAEGGIVDGKGGPGEIGDKAYIKILRKIRRDDHVKAVVLRVNSGGGSALASENIWREIELLKARGIPVIASMGDVAASGGYYILANADKIYLEPTTVTGSIGVFAMIPNVAKLMDDKLGIHYDTVLTNPNAVPLNGYFPLEGQQALMMQRMIDSMYSQFLDRVAQGRHLPKDSVNAIAQGRVWAGTDAIRVGLADAFGDLDDAIAEASTRAGVEHVRIVEYPRTKSKLERLIETLSGQSPDTFSKVKRTAIRKELGEWAPFWEDLRAIKERQGVQMRMPVQLIW